MINVMCYMQIYVTDSAELRQGLRADLRSADTIVVMPYTDIQLAERSARLLSRRAGAEGWLLLVYDKDGEGFVALANLAFRSSQSRYFGYVAQDAFAGRGWLKLALLSLEKESACLLAFNDGKWHGLLAGFGLLKRSWATRNYDGALFFSGYQRHYADAELTLLAKNCAALVYDPRCVVLEVDWDKDLKPVDSEDKKTFYTRADSGFDGRVEDPRFRRILTRRKSV